MSLNVGKRISRNAVRILTITSVLMLGASSPNCVPDGGLLGTGATDATVTDSALTTADSTSLSSGGATTLDGSQLSMDQLNTLVRDNPGKTYVVVFVNPVPGPKGESGVTEHGKLTGLENNDHPQYLLRDEVDSISPQMIQAGAIDETRIRSISAKHIVPQGKGSGLDADTVQGVEVAPIVGEIKMYVGTAKLIPKGWAICDGSAISRKRFSELYNVIGENYGAGDGKSTFNIPDLRDRFAVGASMESGGIPLTTIEGTKAIAGGATMHTLTVGEMPAHNHDMSHTHNVTVNGGVGVSNLIAMSALSTAATVTTSGSSSQYTANTGGGAPHSIVNPYVAVTFIMYIGQ